MWFLDVGQYNTIYLFLQRNENWPAYFLETYKTGQINLPCKLKQWLKKAKVNSFHDFKQVPSWKQILKCLVKSIIGQGLLRLANSSWAT